MKTKMPFGEALRYYRKQRKGLNQKRVAKAVGCEQSMISDIENGKKTGSSGLREKIVEYFDMTYDEFLAMGKRLMCAGTTTASTCGNGHDVAEDVIETISKKIDNLQNTVATLTLTAPPHALKATGSVTLPTPLNARHHSVIDKFEDSETATSINEVLIDIEREDPFEFRETLAELRLKLDKIRKRKETAPSGEAKRPRKTGTDNGRKAEF
jgi:transcriptional regulator with XRE-family HTH domain